jgi:hypothetical protein
MMRRNDQRLLFAPVRGCGTRKRRLGKLVLTLALDRVAAFYRIR